MIPAFRPKASQRITAGATAVSSTPAPAGVALVRVVATDNAAHLSIGGTATNADVYLPVGGVEYFLISESETVSLLRADAADAIVIVTFMSR